MKYHITILFTLIFVSSFGQDTMNYWFDKYYYEKEQIEIPSLQFKIKDDEFDFNQWIAKEKENCKNSMDGISVGLPQDVNIPLLENSREIKKDDTLIYLLHVRGIDMKRAEISLYIDIPKNVIIKTERVNGSICGIYDAGYNTGNSTFKQKGSWTLCEQPEFIIRVIVPKKSKKETKLIIRELYRWEYVKGVTGRTEGALSKSSLSNKSLAETSVMDIPLTCDNYMTCLSDADKWMNEYQGVIQIFYLLPPAPGHSGLQITFSGFMLNTSDNYKMDKSSVPYVLTCFHTLDSVIIQGYSIDDFLAHPDRTKVKFRRYRQTCGGTALNDYWLAPKFKILEKGFWTNVSDTPEDYLFLQFSTVPADGFTIAGIEANSHVCSFPGWRNDLISPYDYADLGGPTYIFHHTIVRDAADDSEMRYAIDNEYAYPSGDLINLTCEDGFSTEGASGSPIFGKDHRIIGMNVAGQNTCLEPDIQGNVGISFSSLWRKANLSKYLGNADSVYSFNANYANLPDYCTDCEYANGPGETGLDCGGPCKPCKTFCENNVEFADFEINPLYVSAQNNITMTGTASKPVIISENTFLSAANEIILNSNVEITSGIDFKAVSGTDPIVACREPDILCGMILPQYIWWGDKYPVLAKNLKRYEVYIFNGEKEVYHGTGEVYYDGWFDVWDSNIGSNVDRGDSMVLFIGIDVWDTANIKHTKTGFVHVFAKA